MPLKAKTKLAIILAAIPAIGAVIVAGLGLMGVITVPFISDYLAHKHAQEQAAKTQ
jgi:hypothetical protein